MAEGEHLVSGDRRGGEGDADPDDRSVAVFNDERGVMA
jgi:hypothetical protein